MLHPNLDTPRFKNLDSSGKGDEAKTASIDGRGQKRFPFETQTERFGPLYAHSESRRAIATLGDFRASIRT
jgi:hypothetical protein